MGKRLGDNEALSVDEPAAPEALNIDVDTEVFWGSDVFPPVPKKPGFHRAWVRAPRNQQDGDATNNFVMHCRWGFRIVPPSEIQGFESHSLNMTINNQACLMVRDTVLMEIPTESYKRIRKVFDDKTEAADRSLTEVPERMAQDRATESYVSRKRIGGFRNRNPIATADDYE